MWFTVVSQNQYWGTRLRKKLLNMRLPRIIEMSNKNTLIQFITQGDITFSDLKVALSRNRSKTTQEYEKSPDEIPPTEILHCGFEVSKRHTQSHILKCDDCKQFAAELADELEPKIATATITNSATDTVDPPKKRSRRYSTDEKRDYIKTFAINDWDAQKTSDETGVPAGTLRDWAKKAKIDLSHRSKTNLSTTRTTESSVFEDSEIIEHKNKASSKKTKHTPRTRYTAEEKSQALSLLARNDADANLTANQLDMPEETLRTWAKDAGLLIPHRKSAKFTDIEIHKVLQDSKNHLKDDGSINVRKLATVHNIAPATVYRWIWKYKESLPVENSLSIKPLSIKKPLIADGGTPAPASFVDSSTQSAELEFAPLIPEPIKGTNTLRAYAIILDNLKSKRESAIDMAEKAKKEMEILQRAEGVAKELKEIDSAFDFVLMKRDR